MPDKDVQKANRRIQKMAGAIQANMDSLYKTTYFTSPQGNRDITDLTQSINDNIDKIVTRNMSTIGMPSISVLYSRMFNKANKQNPITDGISSMFEDPMMMDDLYSTYMSNRFLRELDDEIDTVCKYMTRLEEALNAKKDSVISADHFSKDFLDIKFPTDVDNEQFAQRIVELKKKYHLQKIVEEIYEDTAKYGEKFTYCVPYSTAISRLLANKPDAPDPVGFAFRAEGAVLESAINDAVKEGTERYLLKMDSKNLSIISESGNIEQSATPTIVTESTELDKRTGKDVSTFSSHSILNEKESFSIGVEINTTGIIDSAIQEVTKILNSSKKIKHSSLHEAFTQSVKNGSYLLMEDKNKPQAAGNLNTNNIFKNYSVRPVDGIINTSPQAKDEKNDANSAKYKVKVPGAVIKFLKREMVIPVYIEETCMGYYYIELRTKDIGDDMFGFRNLLGDPMTGHNNARMAFNNIENARQDETIKYVAGQLSQFIDKKFVETNQDLTREIYEILKFNDLFNTPSIDLIKITFVPPEDIFHSYFNFDRDIHRGVSDLAKGLIPAKLFTSLLVTGVIGTMTRGFDKRVYYVNQAVDTNISQQLINVVNQIKMGNFGIRQFNSINNILNITGRFNDYVIPRTPGGDSPVTVDVISGQQFELSNDLMTMLEEMAINATEVPLEIIQTRQSVDYAMQLSMSSSKFLRTVYKRQERVQEILSPFITAIYNYEYGDNTELEVKLPPPVFLDMANTNQLMSNTRDFVDTVLDVEMQDEENNALKALYRKNLFFHYIGTHIDISAHKNILDQTKVQLKADEKESEHVSAEQPEEDYGGGDSW